MDRRGDNKKVQAIRTYADDAERARAKKNMPAAKPRKSTAPEKPQSPIKPEQEQVHTTPHKEVEKKDVQQNFVENPPFHFIRSSSVDDTTFTTKEAMEEAKHPAPKVQHTAKQVNAFTAEIAETLSPQHAQNSAPKRDRVFDSEERESSLEEGTIVTDRRRERFHLFPAIFASLKEWFGEKKEEIEEAQKPKHTVTKAKKRAKIIQAAAATGKHAPRDDYREVTKRLQKTPRITNLEEIQIKDAATVPEASWTYTTDASDTRAEAARLSLEKEIIDSGETPPVGQQKEIIKKPHHVETPRYVEQSVHQTTIPNKEEKPAQAPLPVPQRITPAAHTTVPQPATKPATPPEPSASSLETTPAERKEGNDREPQKPVWQIRIRTIIFTIQHALENRMIFGAIIGMFVFISIGGATVWWLQTHTEKSPTDQTEPVSLIKAQTRTSIPLVKDKSQFIASLMKEVENSPTGILEIHTIVDTKQAFPELVFETLGNNAPGSLVRNVRSISFGAYQKKPFILLRVSSFDAGFSGMLAWEETLQIELAPLFGGPEVTQAQDGRIAAYDIRTLSDASGITRVVYGFANPNIILIAPDDIVFASLLPHIY